MIGSHYFNLTRQPRDNNRKGSSKTAREIVTRTQARLHAAQEKKTFPG